MADDIYGCHFSCRAIIAQLALARTRTVVDVGRAITVGEEIAGRDDWT